MQNKTTITCLENNYFTESATNHHIDYLPYKLHGLQTKYV